MILKWLEKSIYSNQKKRKGFLKMYVVVGLGNPGNEYRMTRHNIGFEVIDYMAGQNNVKINKIKFKAVCGEFNMMGEKVVLLKPQTYMNLSGNSVKEICDFYKTTDYLNKRP